MARCPFVPWDPAVPPAGDLDPQGGVLHDTIGVYSGPDSGDAQYIEDHSLAHFVIGEDEGEWEQQIDTNKVAYHCNGANFRFFGIELSRTSSGQPLTDWQKRALRRIVDWAAEVHAIPRSYIDPDGVPDASFPIDNGTYRGWISHRSVRTGDGSAQHTDYVRAADWEDAMGGSAPSLASVGVDEMYPRILTYAGAPAWWFTWVHPTLGKRVKRPLGNDEVRLMKIESAFIIPGLMTGSGDPYVWAKADVDKIPTAP